MDPTELDHYAVLGLDRRCTLAQIRSAYRLLAKAVHPDLHPDAPDAVERARHLNEAHETLSDPARRRAYDRECAEKEKASAPTPRRDRRARDFQHEVRLRLEEFIRGTTLEVRVNDPGNPDGPESFTLEVPPGTATGSRFRLPRTGAFEGGTMIIRMKLLPNFRFKARGVDLQCDLKIRAQRAAQGGTETISSATGAPLQVRIPAGIERGEVLRIAGHGLPRPRGGRGDLLVRVLYRPEVQIKRGLR